MVLHYPTVRWNGEYIGFAHRWHLFDSHVSGTVGLEATKSLGVGQGQIGLLQARLPPGSTTVTRQ